MRWSVLRDNARPLTLEIASWECWWCPKKVRVQDNLAWFQTSVPLPPQLPVAGAPGLHGVFAARAVMWAFDGASEQAPHRQLPLGVLSAKVPT